MADHEALRGMLTGDKLANCAMSEDHSCSFKPEEEEASLVFIEYR